MVLITRRRACPEYALEAHIEGLTLDRSDRTGRFGLFVTNRRPGLDFLGVNDCWLLVGLLLHLCFSIRPVQVDRRMVSHQMNHRRRHFKEYARRAVTINAAALTLDAPARIARIGGLVATHGARFDLFGMDNLWSFVSLLGHPLLPIWSTHS